MNAVATDFHRFAELRLGAKEQSPAALRAVAQEFEAIFVEQLFKNMRSASFGDSLSGSAASTDRRETYESLFDRQLAVEVASGRGLGLADLLVREFGGKPGTSSSTAPSLPVRRVPATGPATAAAPDPQAFVREAWPHARRAAAALGVAPEALLAQAALESGWGSRVPAMPDGGNSHNVFGIKTGSDWAGASVARTTLEYENGLGHRKRASFRAYPDMAASFEDYARLIGEHPRYRAARNRGADVAGYARALQDAGYATDPDYAAKIGRVLASDTLRAALKTLKDSGHRPINERAAVTTAAEPSARRAPADRSRALEF